MALTHAVLLLTKRRGKAAVVAKDHVRRVRDAVQHRSHWMNASSALNCSDAVVQQWEDFWASKVSTRRASELTVAYLAGPEPLNDFRVLIGLGVLPQNIYGFESDNRTFNRALQQVRDSEYPSIKLVKLPFEQYLEKVPLLFDIVYLDTCGPLPSTGQATLRLACSVFRHQRLNPLAVLITNFAEPDPTNSSLIEAYASLIAAYLFPKPFREVDRSAHRFLDAYACTSIDSYRKRGGRSSLYHLVEKNVGKYYGHFITRQLFDLASLIVPLTSISDNGLWMKFFTRDVKAMAQEIASRRSAEECTDDLGSLVWTFETLLRPESDAPYPVPLTEAAHKLVQVWHRELSGQRTSAKDAVLAYSQLRHSGDQAHLQPAMQELMNHRYEGMEHYTDMATSELAHFPALAQYGFPHHYNASQTKRFKYKGEGKSTWMYLDVIPFDTCRYLYDWLPSTELIGRSFDMESYQLAYRFACDGLAKNIHLFNDEFGYGTHVVPIDEPGFAEAVVSARKIVL